MEDHGGRDQEQRQGQRRPARLPASDQEQAAAHFQHDHADQQDSGDWQALAGHVAGHTGKAADFQQARDKEQHAKGGTAEGQQDICIIFHVNPIVFIKIAG
ncbi:hypothetical protein D3C72_2214180 [compost metagenome]